MAGTSRECQPLAAAMPACEGPGRAETGVGGGVGMSKGLRTHRTGQSEWAGWAGGARCERPGAPQRAVARTRDGGWAADVCVAGYQQVSAAEAQRAAEGQQQGQVRGERDGRERKQHGRGAQHEADVRRGTDCREKHLWAGRWAQ